MDVAGETAGSGAWDAWPSAGRWLEGGSMSQAASVVAEGLARVDFGGWQGGAAREADAQLQRARAHAVESHALLARAEESMRHQDDAIRALLLASVGVA